MWNRCGRWALSIVSRCVLWWFAWIALPMVCGVLRPVLALPAEEGLDDHVLLHELLHIKYFDALQKCVLEPLPGPALV